MGDAPFGKRGCENLTLPDQHPFFNTFLKKAKLESEYEITTTRTTGREGVIWVISQSLSRVNGGRYRKSGLGNLSFGANRRSLVVG